MSGGGTCGTCGASFLPPSVQCGICGGAFTTAIAIQTMQTNEIIAAEFPEQLSPVMDRSAPRVARLFTAVTIALCIAALVVVYFWHF